MEDNANDVAETLSKTIEECALETVGKETKSRKKTQTRHQSTTEDKRRNVRQRQKCKGKN